MIYGELFLSSIFLYLIDKAIDKSFTIGFPRPNFITGGFFGGKNVDGFYTRNTQRQTISGLVGSYDLALKYIEETSDVFLGKLL